MSKSSKKGQLEKEFDRLKRKVENSCTALNVPVSHKDPELLSNQVAEVMAKSEQLMTKVEALDLRRSEILRKDENRISSEKRDSKHAAELRDTQNLEKRVRVIAAFRLVFEFVVPLIMGFYAIGSLFRGHWEHHNYFTSQSSRAPLTPGPL